ncbi:peptidase M24, structural domain-containing protein [Mycena rebaudengoi]|nr:peptidase M24, structural domain-containing protein [Mycena rebaudengoi]
MAELLGIVASTLQLVDTASKAVKYVKDFKNAPAEQRKLYTEIDELRPLLAELHKRIATSPSTSIFQNLALPLERLRKPMAELTAKVKQPDDPWSHFSRQLTWTLWDRDEAKEYLAEFESVKLLLNTWLTLDIWSAIYRGVAVERRKVLAGSSLEEHTYVDWTGDIGRRLDALRELMKSNGLDYYVIPSEDAHQSQYVACSDMRLEYISGFSLPSAWAIVSRTRGYLITEYPTYLELDPNWILVQVGGAQEPKDWIEWLTTKVRGSRIGIDVRMISYEKATRLIYQLHTQHCTLTYPPQNLVDLVWTDKPHKCRDPVYRQPFQFTGEEASIKLYRLREWIGMQPLHVATLISSLPAIAYLLNLRGSDIRFDPVFRAYLFVGLQVTILFVDAFKVDEDIGWYLNSIAVERRDYVEIWQFLRRGEWGAGKILITPETAFGISLLIQQRYSVVPSFVEQMMNFKNETEINGMKQAFLRDNISFVRFLAWLDTKLSNGYNITEWEARQCLIRFLQVGEYFLGLARPIMSASGPNAARPHYWPPRSTAQKIDRETPYLIDSGVHYQDGTCDTVRSMHFGDPTNEQIDAFTRLLRGQIAIETAISAGTSSPLLEVLARQAFFRDGVNFSVCSLHDAPEFRTSLLPGYYTVESGVYRPGHWGLRIKSTLIMHGFLHPGGTEWIQLEHLTNVPIQSCMVRGTMLSTEEKQWLRAYNQRCFNLLTPHLNGDARTLTWLTRETAASASLLSVQPLISLD